MPEEANPDYEHHYNFRAIDLALRLAVNTFKVEDVKQLLDQGANPEAIEQGCCTLMAAKVPATLFHENFAKCEQISKMLHDYTTEKETVDVIGTDGVDA